MAHKNNKPANHSSSTVDRESMETIAMLFKAFADPNRLHLIQSLRSQPKSVGELVNNIGLSQANVSKHLQILFDAKILSREKRGTSTFYSIDDDIVFSLCDLVCNKLNKDQESKSPIQFDSEVDYQI